ncbi:zinc finger (Ran-binding) family protein [Actinidia rufa]|uniref:Zinc finger (Ran-binding) family protein n=1 Tax=Actinidia rufa TaxID=165716 RepID=A0A7J0FWC5_9ERIC|nr:zinc finger (Ran-binding) family protein [Actinidia rufa]
MEVVHPWTEWIELMERLVQQNYFDHRRKDEEKMVKMVQQNYFDGESLAQYCYEKIETKGKYMILEFYELDEDFPLDIRAQAESFKGHHDDSYASNRTPRAHDRENYVRGQKKPGTGFADINGDDDVDSYELDTQKSNQVQRRSSIDFSEVEGSSESYDTEDFYADRIARQSSSWSRDKPSKRTHRKSTFSGSDADEQDFCCRFQTEN